MKQDLLMFLITFTLMNQVFADKYKNIRYEIINARLKEELSICSSFFGYRTISLTNQIEKLCQLPKTLNIDRNGYGKWAENVNDSSPLRPICNLEITDKSFNIPYDLSSYTIRVQYWCIYEHHPDETDENTPLFTQPKIIDKSKSVEIRRDTWLRTDISVTCPEYYYPKFSS